MTVCGLLLSCLCGSAVNAADRPAIATGEVNANDVYVRSGPSLNHYTICKLAAGDRVTIMGERGNWYEIVPPEGAFSLISGEYVDTADNKTGVVNGNNVRVRAGSQLSGSKYTVQTKLSKGAEVAILGVNPDGFLRIVPPPDVTLWITRDYVVPVPAELLQADRQTPKPAEVSDENPEQAEAAGDRDSTVEPAQSAWHKPSTTLESMPPTSQRRTLIAIDEETRTELQKPVLDRKLDSLVERYGEIAAQQEDAFAALYATRRLEQVDDAISLGSAVRTLRELDDRAESMRRELMTKRANLHTSEPPSPAALDAKGELRVSALYTGGATPRRYRLVDPADSRTIAYAEIPEDSALKVEDYIGRYVGIRASSARLITGSVNSIPVYVVSELILLEPPRTRPASGLSKAN